MKRPPVSLNDPVSLLPTGTKQPTLESIDAQLIAVDKAAVDCIVAIESLHQSCSLNHSDSLSSGDSLFSCDSLSSNNQETTQAPPDLDKIVQDAEVHISAMLDDLRSGARSKQQQLIKEISADFKSTDAADWHVYTLNALRKYCKTHNIAVKQNICKRDLIETIIEAIKVQC